MKGDFTRFTHDATKHFNRVYKQQGRAELDADFNEYVDLSAHLQRTEAVDVIGRVGVPKGDSFKVDVINNTELRIRKGRLYVDGLLCSLEDDASYTLQPGDVPQPALNFVSRKDLVFLDVMERHVTWVEDDALLEPALQGVDTCTRVQTVARVRVQADIGANSTCGAVVNWPPAASGGRLTTDTKAVGPAPNPCVIPASAGYRGLENRLYRVEVHSGDTLANATFKWSRDNGAVVVPIAFIGETHRVQAKTLGRDQVLGLKVGDWVELESDHTDLNPVSGTLAQILAITPDLIIQLSKDISVHQTETHPKLRRWDQASEAVSMQGGAILDLDDDGITIQFSGDKFQVGDYWMFTARVGAGVQKLKEAPPAVIHHYAPLAIITWLRDPQDTAAITAHVEPCRLEFPPVTDIHATDVKFNGKVCQFGAGVNNVQEAIDALCAKQEECCTVVVRPGPNWQQVFENLPPQGAHLCFRPGIYEIANRVQVTNRESIVISGAGGAARIVALHDECALRFINCGTVIIRDFSAEGRVPRLGSGRKEAGTLGVISVTDAASVVVENCHLQSADGPHRTTACLSVHGAQHAVVRGNRFEVGVQQGGVLLANVQNLQVESNLITGSSRSIGKMVGLLNDPQFLAAVRTRLVAHLFVGSLPPPGVIINVSDIIVGGQEVRFLAPVTHIVPWRNLLEQHQLPGNPAVATIENHVLGLANRILLENIVPSFAGIRNTILGNSTGSAQGITVGGTIGESIVIRNNRVSEFMQGIHVGLSAPSPNISLADRVVIHDNQIGVTLGMGATRGRHGVFVGNVRSLSIRGNRVTLARPSGTQNMQVDGIRVFGRLGRMAIIRENHLTGFNIGVRFELRGALPLTPMWMINDNLAEGSNPAVRAPDAANKSNNFA